MASLPRAKQLDAAATAEAGMISKVLIVMAMEAEAMLLVHNFKLDEAPAHESIFPKDAPWIRYHGKYKSLHIDLVRPGKDIIFGVDSVGTVSAALLTYASIQTLKPDLIINAGTAGGFNAKGASVGDVYLASDVAFHDRRIPIPVFDMYGVGARKTFATPNLLKELNFKGAAVAYVADMFSTPAIFVKAATDIVDGEKPTTEEFLMNLRAVTATLELAVVKVVDFISGKHISDL